MRAHLPSTYRRLLIAGLLLQPPMSVARLETRAAIAADDGEQVLSDARFTYDADNHLVRIDHPNAPPTTFTYDAAGEPVTMTDALGRTRWEWDVHGRLSAATDAHGFGVNYGYEGERLRRVEYSDGTRVEYAWDRGTEVSVTDAKGTRCYTTDRQGRLVRRVLPDGQSTAIDYDAIDRPVRVRDTDALGVTRAEHRYRYDDQGRLTAWAHSVGGAARERVSYEYDADARLTQVTRADGERLSYEYTPRGSVSAIRSSAGGTVRFTYDGDLLTRVDSPAGVDHFTYDRDGMPSQWTSPAGTTTRWEFTGTQLDAVHDGRNRVEFRYDGLGRPLEVVANGTATRWAYDTMSGRLLGQVMADGRLTLPEPALGAAAPANAWRDRLEVLRRAADPFRQVLADFGGESGVESLRHYLERLQTLPVAGADGQLDFAFGQAMIHPRRVIGRFGHAVMGGLDALAIGKEAVDASQALRHDMPGAAAAHVGTIGAWFAADAAASAVLATAFPAAAAAGPPVWAAVGMVAAFSVVANEASQYLAIGGSLVDANRQIDNSLRRYVHQVAATGLSRDQVREVLAASTVWRASGRRAADLERYVRDVRPNAHIFERADAFTLDLSDPPPSARDEARRWKPIGSFLPAGLGGGPPGPPPGGPRPGSAPVGGITLDRVAEVIAEIGTLVGASYDAGSGELVLVGDGTHRLPLRLGDLVVALRAQLAGEEVGISIEPCTPGAEDGCMKVLYDGRFLARDPEGAPLWATLGAPGDPVAVEPPVTFESAVGAVLFASDWFLKTASHGRDARQAGAPFDAGVPGFDSLLDRLAAVQSRIAPGDCMVHEPRDRSRPSSCFRLWLVPGPVVIERDGGTIRFREDPEEPPIVAQARFVRFEPKGRMVDVPGNDPVVSKWVGDFTRAYRQLVAGGREPALGRLVEVARAVALARWLAEQAVPVDPEWLATQPVEPGDTPTTAPGGRAQAGTVALYGGVDFPHDTTHYVPATTATARFREATIAARGSRADLAWNVALDGRTLRAAAVRLAPAPIDGAFAVVRTEGRVTTRAGAEARLERRYSSADARPGAFGPGWTLGRERVRVVRRPEPDTPALFSTHLLLDIAAGSCELTQTTDGDFRPVDASALCTAAGITTAEEPFAPRRVPELRIEPALAGGEVTIRNARDERVAWGGFAVGMADGTMQAFDRAGRLRALRDAAGGVLRWTYDDAGRLTALASSDGDTLTIVWDGARIAEIFQADGRTVAYRYAADGRLAAAGAGERYRYDNAGRLTHILDADGRIMRENAYDGAGRLVRIGDAVHPAATIAYDDRRGAVRLTEGAGRVVTREMRADGRRIVVADVDGRRAAMEYDAGGRLVRAEDARGHATVYTYGAAGELTEIVSPNGRRTRFLDHDIDGRPRLVVDPLGRMRFLEYAPDGTLNAVRSGFVLTGIAGEKIAFRAVDPQRWALGGGGL